MEVVSVYNRNKMDKHEKTIRSKWVFKVKSDGRYRARLCLFGFQQEEGVNYFLNYSPVVNDITTKVLFMIGTISGNNMRLVDITKSFMESKLKERVYIEIPDGYSEINSIKFSHNEVMKLNKDLYGLKQASKCFYDFMKEYLIREMKFQKCLSDSCLFKNEEDSLWTGIYVDDILLVGNDTIIEETIKKLSSRFNITTKESVDEYVGCQLESREDVLFIHQRRLVDELVKKFENKIKNIKLWSSNESTHYSKCT